MQVRGFNDFDPDKNSMIGALGEFEAPITVQDEREEADINVIVKRFGVTGQLPQGVRAPTYGDFTGVGDYRSAVEAVKAAQDAFMQLDADVRYRFKNDPQLFVEFASDPANLPEMRKMGLAIPEKLEDIKPTPPVVGVPK